MTSSYLWLALLMAAVATILIRTAAAGLSKSSIFDRMNEDTLSRVFPLVILFILVFKEIASTSSQGPYFGLTKLTGVLLVATIHLWKRSLFLSVIGGTALYIALNNFLAAG